MPAVILCGTFERGVLLELAGALVLSVKHCPAAQISHPWRSEKSPSALIPIWRSEAKGFYAVPALSKAGAGAVTTTVLPDLNFSTKEEGKKHQQIEGKAH